MSVVNTMEKEDEFKASSSVELVFMAKERARALRESRDTFRLLAAGALGGAVVQNAAANSEMDWRTGALALAFYFFAYAAYSHGKLAGRLEKAAEEIDSKKRPADPSLDYAIDVSRSFWRVFRS